MWCAPVLLLAVCTWTQKGPKKKHCDAVKRLIEDHGYRCGDIIRVFKNGDVLTSWDESSDKEINDLILFCKESHVCGTTVESQYYAPPTETERGRRVTTKHVCCVVMQTVNV